MLPREERYIYEWETKRGKGKWTYVFLTAFIWGSLAAIVIEAFMLALKGRLSFGNLALNLFQIDFFPLWIKFVCGFFFFALLMWRLAKKKYIELKQKQQSRKEIQVPQ